MELRHDINLGIWWYQHGKCMAKGDFATLSMAFVIISSLSPYLSFTMDSGASLWTGLRELSKDFRIDKAFW